jgi:4-amino-4-deoxy-L-arabinose transferase-like glycosyltransferase
MAMELEKFCKKYSVLFLFIILVLAVFFRLYQLTIIPPGLYPDEAMNGNNALEAIHTGNYKIFYPENNGREGLFINIQSLSLRIFGNEPWALRIVSAMFGIFTVLGLYFLTKELFKACMPSGKEKSIALFASFFLATSFWHINFSRIGFRAIMAPFFLVWSFWLLWKIINKLERRNPKHVSLLSLIAGLLFGLGFHSYIAYRIASILLLPLFFLLLKNKNFKPIILFCVGASIAILPLALYFISNPQDFLGRTSQISIFSSDSPLLELGKNIVETIGMFFFAGDFNWRHNYAGAPALWWPVAILFLIGIISQISRLTLPKDEVFGGRAKIKSQNYILNLKSIFLILWLIIMLAPVVISNENLPHSLRAITVIPVVMIFVGLGMERVMAKIKKGAVIFMFIFFIIVFTHSFNLYFLKWSVNPNVLGAFASDYVETAKRLNEYPLELPKYVIIEAKGVDVRGIPMPAQTVMFLTKTFLPEWQKEKNIFYILLENAADIPNDAKVVWLK